MKQHTTSPLAIIVLAAGKGTRMKSDLPKVLHPLAQRPLILHVLEAAAALNPNHLITITGHGAPQVEAAIKPAFPAVTCIRQTEQKGTGHAVLQAKEALADFAGTVLILNGDVPLLTTNALAQFLQSHQTANQAVTLATTEAADPTGLGRILRDDSDIFIDVREEKDCTEDEAEITEVNVGFYAVESTALWKLIDRITNTNTQQEYYLPDIVPIALKDGLPVGAVLFEQDPEELMGINTRAQLADAEYLMQARLRHHHMQNGATLQDPETTYFAWDTKLGQDVTIEPNVYFGEKVNVADNVTIHAFSHLAGCTIASGAMVGPFARLRSGTQIGENSEIGCFVVTKKANIAANVKAKQLNCLVDCEISENTNIGAGAVIANYHHFKKQKAMTTIANNASIGANSVLVAPVEIGEKAFVAAGTVARKNVPAESLLADRPEQTLKLNYKPTPKK